MRSMNFLFANLGLSIAILFMMLATSDQCDTKWIRLVYSMACGSKKKRKHTDLNFPDSSERDNESVGSLLLLAMTGDHDSDIDHDIPTKDEILTAMIENAERSVNKEGGGVAIGGMRPEDSLAILQDLMDDDEVSELDRRGIDKLVQECCKIAPKTKCTAKDFANAC